MLVSTKMNTEKELTEILNRITEIKNQLNAVNVELIEMNRRWENKIDTIRAEIRDDILYAMSQLTAPSCHTPFDADLSERTIEAELAEASIDMEDTANEN